MRLDDLNQLDPDSATRALLPCCGSTRWAGMMAAARPFPSVDAMVAAADKVSASLEAADWLEAFAAHPRIGGKLREARGVGLGAEWSAIEQSGIGSASAAVRERLAARNRDYEARFGYIFIVCAAGKSADEMLAAIERRLTNDAAVELRVAAEEQRRITHLRLAALLDE
jgi:OHCU decarboxylase